MNQIKYLVFGLLFYPLCALSQEKYMVEFQRIMVEIQMAKNRLNKISNV